MVVSEKEVVVSMKETVRVGSTREKVAVRSRVEGDSEEEVDFVDAEEDREVVV